MTLPSTHVNLTTTVILSKLSESLTLSRTMQELESKGFDQFSKQCTSVVCHARMQLSPNIKSSPISLGMGTLSSKCYMTWKRFLTALSTAFDWNTSTQREYMANAGEQFKVSMTYIPRGHVKVNSCLSPDFEIERGVRQDSVLSLTLWSSAAY